MKINGKTLVFIGALALVPALALAQAKPAPAAPKTAAKTAVAAPTMTVATAPAKPTATHATNGIVKSADATSLIITKTAKDTKAVTFVLNAATVTKGTLAPGARVAVRYRTEGTQNIATAVTAGSPKSGK